MYICICIDTKTYPYVHASILNKYTHVYAYIYFLLSVFAPFFFFKASRKWCVHIKLFSKCNYWP